MVIIERNKSATPNKSLSKPRGKAAPLPEPLLALGITSKTVPKSTWVDKYREINAQERKNSSNRVGKEAGTGSIHSIYNTHNMHHTHKQPPKPLNNIRNIKGNPRLQALNNTNINNTQTTTNYNKNTGTGIDIKERSYSSSSEEMSVNAIPSVLDYLKLRNNRPVSPPLHIPHTRTHIHTKPWGRRAGGAKLYYDNALHCYKNS